MKLFNKLQKSKKEDSFPGTFEDELRELLSAKASAPKTSFEIQNVKLTPDNISNLATALQSSLVSSSLTSLSLIGTKLANSTQLTPFVEALKITSALKVLNLSDNPLKDEGVTILAQVIKYKHNIVELYLCETGFGTQGSKSLKAMLEINKSITVLDVSQNPIGDQGVKYICQGLLDSPLGERSQIVKLDFSETGFGDNGSKIVGSVLASSASLKEINLSDNAITKVGAKYISHGLMKKHVKVAKGEGDVKFEGLELLNLSNNQLGDEGVGHIAKRLPASGAIKQLFLTSVGMQSNSLTKLCQSLKDCDSVEKLAIGSNPIEGDSLASNVINLVEETSNLVDLDLSKIALSKEDVKNLAEFIRNHIKNGLLKLNLAATGIDDDGAVEIANALKENNNLKELNVTSNPFGPKGAKTFSKTFKRAKTLEKFFITGQSRIGAEGENYLAEALKFNKKLRIYGASRELDYINEFVYQKKAFILNSKGEIIGWSEAAWEVVKRGCGQIIGTVIYNMSNEERKHLKEKVLLESRNVVKQDMFEYVLRHAVAPALDVVNIFINKCKIHIDDECKSLSGAYSALEKRKSDYTTYRTVAKDCAKDPMVQAMAKNNRLFLGRYLTENGPAIHETPDVTRFAGTDTTATGDDKKKRIFVQVYDDDEDFKREYETREELKHKLRAGGPFAIYDTILREIEVHEEHEAISFKDNITDLRHCINNLGVTSGYDIHETVFLAKRAAQCLGTINNLGRIHGDFRPRNFLKVAKKRLGTDPVGRTNAKVLLPDKWVVFDFSKSTPHGKSVFVRTDSSYMPPEVAKVSFNKDYTKKQLPLANEKMDVWSFGVVLYQLLTGTHLFHMETNSDKIYKSKERLELMNWINLDAKRHRMILHRANESQFANPTTYKKIKTAATDLVNWCLQGDPYNRPSFNEILAHPFFQYKTHVNYTDVDLLLGWYKKIGSDISTAQHKNNRTHAHVVNTVSKATADIYETLKFYYTKAGCKITNDSEDWKLDIGKKKEKVQKAKTLIVLLEKDIFWRREIIQKLLWSMDSVETNNLILIDISTAYTNAERFDFDEYINELESDEGKKRLDNIVKSLTPIEEKLSLSQLPYPQSASLSKERKWLRSYLVDEINEYIMSLKDKVIPYRTREFQTQAMVNEILRRSGFVDIFKVTKSTLVDPPKQEEEKNNEEEVKEKEEKEKKSIKILILYNEETNQVTADKILSDAQALRKKLCLLGNKETKVDVVLIGEAEDVYKHFKMEISREEDTEGNFSVNRVLSAETMTLVLCMVSQGFYDVYREQVVLLNSAKGLVSVVPISYGHYDVTKTTAMEEVLNLGLENSTILEKLKDNRSYIPLPGCEKNLQYETDAAISYIMKEAKGLVDLTKKNEEKDENDAYVRYSKTNFFAAVH